MVEVLSKKNLDNHENLKLENVNELLYQVKKSLDKYAKSKRLILKIDRKSKTLEVELYKFAFLQIAYNVMLNAIENSDFQGEIFVKPKL